MPRLNDWLHLSFVISIGPTYLTLTFDWGLEWSCGAYPYGFWVSIGPLGIYGEYIG